MDTTQRETIEVSTKHAHKCKMYAYIKAKEKRALRDIYLKEMTVDSAGSVATFKGFKPATINEGEDYIFKILIVELDGSTENILERLQDLPAEDYQEIFEKVDEVSNPEKKT